ncbi:MAG TPA: DNA repair protein RadC [Thermomicrobiales bacterium]|nr:DNA repair protein RadC [Thermomicrobiales bacterium]
MEPERRNGLSLKELPADERPREKLSLRGPGALSNAELLAIMLNTGTKGESVMALAQRIIAESGGGLRGLMRRDLDSLLEVHGLGPAKAIKMIATIELAKRIAALGPEDRPQIRTPEDAAIILLPRMTALDHEELHVAVLDTKHRIERIVTVYQGSVNAAQVRIAEVFKEAVRANCPAIVVAHNHPSGDPTPSAADISLTSEMSRAADLLDIDLIDHLIIGDGRWISLRRLGLGFSAGR